MTRVERHLLNLDELELLAMSASRHLHAQLLASPKHSHSLFLAFERATLAVRRCILLSQWLEAGCPVPKPSAPRPEPVDAPKARHSEPTGAIRLERVERIDFGPNPETALEDGRFDEAIEDLKRLLTLEPGLDPSPEAVATRLVAAEASARPRPPDG